MPGGVRGQLIVTSGSEFPENWTADSLVRNVLLGGNGVMVSNVMLNGSSDVLSTNLYGESGNNMIGMFSTGEQQTDLGFEEGIILSNGCVRTAIGPNGECDPSSSCNSRYNCRPLEEMGEQMYDIVVLEFDFIPSTNRILFEYVFGSYEYPEYVHSYYNDRFGIFITGENPDSLQSGYDNKNIALIPNTVAPVSIDNVNYRDYSEYYIDNEGGQWVGYDGYTVPLVAWVAVVPNRWYHIMFAIGDCGDNILDSGVFLKANSFMSLPRVIHETICAGECYNFFNTSICESGVYVHGEGVMKDTLYLQVAEENPVMNVYDTIVQNQLPWTFAGNEYWSGVTNDSIICRDRYGCDSMVVYNLMVHKNSLDVIDTIICPSEFPFEWYGHTFTEEGEYSNILRGQYGEDSVISYCVMAYQSYRREDSDTICEGMEYAYEGEVYSMGGTHCVSYQTVNGCDSCCCLQLTVTANPNAHIIMDPEVADVEHQVINIEDGSKNETMRQWIIEGGNYGDEEGITYQYPVNADSVEVRLIAYNGEECTDTAYAVIYMDRCALWIPNVIMPIIPETREFGPYSECLKEMEMWIYNRGGVQVYHTTDVEGKWNGKEQRTGKRCPAGSYVYKIKYRMTNHPEEEEMRMGTVMLLR